jgi:hypothetical protein
MYVIPYKRVYERYKSANRPTILKLGTIHLLAESFPTRYLSSAEFGQELPKIDFFPFGCSSVLTLKKAVLRLKRGAIMRSFCTVVGILKTQIRFLFFKKKRWLAAQYPVCCVRT